MNRKRYPDQTRRRNSGRGRKSGAVRMPAYVNAEEEAFAMEVPNVGLGRIFGIVLIMHIVAVGGILAFKWIERDTERMQQASGNGSGEAAAVSPEPVDEQEGQDGARGMVSEDQRPGYLRYRVASGDRLVDIARRFDNSVSEIERLNGIEPGSRLDRGEWITLRDRKSSAPDPVVREEPPAPSRPAQPAQQDKPKETTLVARVLTDKSPQPKPEPPATDDAARARALRQLRPMGDAASPQAAQPQQPAQPASGRTYEVQPGDTAYGIATKFNTDWETLLQANGIDDPRLLKAGAVIRIP